MATLNYTLTIPSSYSGTRATEHPPTPLFSQSSPKAGFGEYEEFASEDFKAYQTAQKTHALIVSVLIGTVTTGLIITTSFFPILIWVAPPTIAALAVLGVRAYLKYSSSLNHFPPSLTSDLNPQNFQAKRVGEVINEMGSALVLSDAVEVKKYKLDLIRNAQSSIFLSCYMGEEALDEALDLIKTRMDQKRELKVFLLGSNHFLTSENHRRLDDLKATHPHRFFSVLHPEMHYSQHPKKGSLGLSSNHIKLTVIDQGAYSIIGGSALRPFWTDITGTEHLNKTKQTFDIFQNPIEAKGFRDMDFAFKSAPGGAGTTAFLEGAKLMLRYAYFESPALAEQLKTQFLQIMRIPPPLITTAVPSFDSRPERASNIGMKVYATGPDHTHNSYLHALIDLINQARDRVVLAHMYFHPPQQLIDALSNAAKRGVKIDIITNSKDKGTPLAHRFFVDLAQDKYRQLFQREGSQNVKVYEYYRANTTYHKKVIIVDQQYTGFGSSNLGTKSLEETPTDYELNAIANSPVFAAATMCVLEKDMQMSNQVSPEKALHPSWDTRLLARFQEQVMTYIL